MSFSNPSQIIHQLYLDPGMTIVDLGAGSGHYTLLAAEHATHQGKVYAIDIQKELLSRIKAHAKQSHLHNVEVIMGDIEKIGGTGLKDKEAHFAIAANVLFQLSDKKTFAKEVKRILKQGGRVALIDWSDSFGGIGPHKDHVVSLSFAKPIFVDEGFVFERQIPAGEHHWGMMLRKV